MVLPKRLSFTSYFFFGLILLIGLFWFRFPQEAAEEFLVNQIENSLPRFACTASQVSFRLPFSLHVDLITLNEKHKKTSFLELEDIVITPKFNDPFNSFQVTGSLHGGKISADIVRQPLKKSLEIPNFSLVNVPLVLGDQNKQNSLTGTMDATGKYRIFYLKEKAYSEFDTTITIRDALLKRKSPFLTLNNIDITLAKLSLTKKNNKLILGEGTVKGNELHISLSGGIKPLLPAERTTLQLRGKVTPQQALLAENSDARKQLSQLQKKFRKKALPFVISGEISSPVFTIKN